MTAVKTGDMAKRKVEIGTIFGLGTVSGYKNSKDLTLTAGWTRPAHCQQDPRGKSRTAPVGSAETQCSDNPDYTKIPGSTQRLTEKSKVPRSYENQP
jgi:hypothetical protein